MSKVIKKLAITTLHTLAGVVLALILLILAVAMALSTPRVQSFAARKATSWLSQKTDTHISVRAISIEKLTTIVAEELYVEDLEGDTLLWVSKASANIDREALLAGGPIKPHNIKAYDALFDMKTNAEGVLNLDTLIRHIAAHFPADTTATTGGITLSDIEAHRLRYRLYDARYAGRVPEGVIDYSDMDLMVDEVAIGTISVEGPVVTLTDVERLNATDRSGAGLENSAFGSLTVGDALLDFRGIDFHHGATHLNVPTLIIRGQSWDDYSDFCDKVTLVVETRGSSLEPATAGQFVDVLGTLGLEGTDISGIFKGTVCDFMADLTAHLYDSDVQVIGEVKELLHPERLTADAYIEVATTASKVADIYNRILHQPLPEQFAEWISPLGALAIDGHFVVDPQSVGADALVATSLGDVEVDGTLGFGGGRVSYNGTLRGSNIALGEIAHIDPLGTTDLEAEGNIAVAEGDIEGTIEAQLERLGWGDYEFAAISLGATKQGGAIEASASSSDPNLSFVLDAEASTSGSTPECNLLLSLERANLQALGVAGGSKKMDTTEGATTEGAGSWLAGNLEASLAGTTLDNMNVRAMINELVYATPTDTLSTEIVNISMTGAEGERSREFSLYSTLVDVTAYCSVPYSDVVGYVTQTLAKNLPIPPYGSNVSTEEAPSFASRNEAKEALINVKIKEGEALASVLMPGSDIAPDSTIEIEISPSNDACNLFVSSDYLIVGDIVLSDLSTTINTDQYGLEAMADCSQLLVGSVTIPDVDIRAACARKGDVALALNFSNTDAALSGRVGVEGVLSRSRDNSLEGRGTFENSYLITPNERWDITAEEVEFVGGVLTASNFKMGNDVGGVYIDGPVTVDPTTPLSVLLKNISIGDVLTLTGVAEGIDGTLDGALELYSLPRNPYGVGSIVFSSMSAGGVDIDPLNIDLEMPAGSTNLNLEVDNSLLDTRLLVGRYDYANTNYEANLHIEQLDLSVLNPLLGGVLSGTEGNSAIDMTLAGEQGKLSASGGVRVTDFATRIDFTGARYTTPAIDINFDNNRGLISPVRLEDGEGGWAELEGYIDFNQLSSPDFGITLVPHNLVAIDLKENSESPFYGKVYASGGAKLTSTGGATEISGAISTGRGSIFSIPLKGNNDFAGADFVTFVDRSAELRAESDVVARKRSEMQSARHAALTPNLSIDLMLGVDTDTQLRLLIDPATENIIEARGEADLGITLDSRKKDLAIRGDYQISEGVYNFNFQNIITKQFTINPDSYIRWNGDPLDANIDVGATYKLKTSLAPLLGAESTASRASTPVECIVDLTGSLSKVDVSFDINVPTANTEYQSILSSYFSSQEMMATQFVYLLALGNFYSDTTTGPATTAGTAGTAIGLDFLASQVSRLVSNDAYKFNLKYKAIDDTSSSYSIDFQTEIIDDRLLLELEANVDTGDYYQSINGDANQLSGGGAITLFLDDAGDFYLKGFSRTIDRFDENQGLQENGVGLYYKRSFNRLSDLWRKKKRAPEEDSEKSDKFAADDTTEAIPSAKPQSSE